MAQTDRVESLLAAARDAEERCRRYSRQAALLDNASLILYISAAVVFGASLAAYLLYGSGYMPLIAAGLALWWSAAAARILYHNYDSKAAKAAEQACVYRKAARLIMEEREVKAKLEAAAGSGQLAYRAN